MNDDDQDGGSCLEETPPGQAGGAADDLEEVRKLIDGGVERYEAQIAGTLEKMDVIKSILEDQYKESARLRDQLEKEKNDLQQNC